VGALGGCRTGYLKFWEKKYKGKKIKQKIYILAPPGGGGGATVTP